MVETSDHGVPSFVLHFNRCALCRRTLFFKKEDYAEAARIGEEYLSAIDVYRNDIFRDIRVQSSSLRSINDSEIAWLRIHTAEAYLHLGSRPERALELLRGIPWSGIAGIHVERVITDFIWLYVEYGVDCSDSIRECWDGICIEKPTPKIADGRKKTFLATATNAFTSDFFCNATTGKSFYLKDYPPYDLFLSLLGRCVLGVAAAIMKCESKGEADVLLAQVEDFTELPFNALRKVIRLGAAFPPLDREITSETMQFLVMRLAEKDASFLRETAVSAAYAMESPQDTCWACYLALAALQLPLHQVDEDYKALICAFVRIESCFLPLCYNVNALQKPEYLPPMHRFGLHLANAFAVIKPTVLHLDFLPTVAVELRSAVTELRYALRAAPEKKEIISWLLDEVSNVPTDKC